MRDRVANVTTKTLNPILNICKNSVSNTESTRANSHHSDYSKKQQLYYAFIHGHWPNFTTESADIIIEGWWNFKFINIEFVNYTVIMNNVRIENIKGNIIKRITGSNDTTYLINDLSYFSLSIHEAEKKVKVTIPESLKYSITIAPNVTLSRQESNQMMTNLQLAIASYTEESIWSKIER